MKKPSELLKLYSTTLSTILEERMSFLTFSLNFTYQSPQTAFVKGSIIFRNMWILDFQEIIVQRGISVERIKYRYHLMDESKQLIFRYDNVPHFSKIKSHPHHKHTLEGVLSSKAPGFIEIIAEVEDMMVRGKL